MAMACNGMDQVPDSTSTTIPAVGLIMYPQDNSLKAFRSIINPNALILSIVTLISFQLQATQPFRFETCDTTGSL